MNAFLANMSNQQAMEWEMFTRENPLPEDVIVTQIAMIAQMFASAHLQRKDKKGWELSDFIPDFSKQSKSTDKVAKSILSTLGIPETKKARKQAKKQAQQHEKGVIGTDGKRYKYKLEEFIKERKTLPKRLQKKRGTEWI